MFSHSLQGILVTGLSEILSTLLFFVSQSLGSKEVLDQCSAFVFEQPRLHINRMVQTGVSRQIVARSGSAAFGVLGPEDYLGNPCLQQCAHTHDAGFNGDV